MNVKIKVSEWTIISEDGVIYLLHKGTAYKINKTGKEIIDLLRKGFSLQEIAEYLVDKYNISSEKAQKDVNAFIESLRKIDAIEVVSFENSNWD